MQYRTFGRTGLQLSVLGFGCGAVGGFMVRGDPAEQERTIAHAMESGVNYFDTAVQYGNGESEKNLGRILQKLKPASIAVGTKVRLQPDTFGRVADAVAASIEGSLSRLRLDRIDIFHLHNPITATGGGTSLGVRQVLDDVVPAFERLRAQGQTRFLGLTAVGDTAALRQVIEARVFDSAQIVYNMLNPSAGEDLPPNYPDACSTRPRPPVLALWASACWPAARCQARPSATRSPARRPNRSARPSAMLPISIGRAACCRWSRKAMSPASPKPRRDLRRLIRRWAPSWSAWRRRSNSRTHSPRSRKARYRRLRWSGCHRCGGLFPVNLADRRLFRRGIAQH